MKPSELREKEDIRTAELVFGSSTLAYLRKLSVGEIEKALIKSTLPTSFGPDIDGYFLPNSVPKIYLAGGQAQIPLLAGWTSDEGRNQVIFPNPSPTPASFAAEARSQFGESAPQFLALYPGTTDQDLLNSAADYAGDHSIAYSTWRWLESQLQTSRAPVFRYFFKRSFRGDTNHPVSMGAFHSDDIEYVFGTLDSRPGFRWNSEDYNLSKLMQSYWTNFARTGNPNGIGLPTWPAYNSPGGWQVMDLDANPAAKSDPHRDRYVFLDKAWGHSE